MAREIIRGDNQSSSRSRSIPIGQRSETGRRNQLRVRKDPRSRAYLDAVRKMDVGVASSDADISELEAAIAAEFSGFSEFLPIGLVAQCYLGPPYEVHTLDRLARSIIDHYPVGHVLPDNLEQARRLALHPAYEVIEVYQDRLLAIAGDGTVVELKE